MPAIPLRLPRLSLPSLSAPPTTIAAAASLATLAYNLAVVFFPLPELRIATAEALTIGLGAAGVSLLSAKPRARTCAAWSTIGLGIAFLFAGVWYAGKTGTPIPRLGLDFITAAGLFSLALPLRSTPRATPPAPQSPARA